MIFSDESVEFLVFTYDYLCRVYGDEQPPTGYLKHIHKKSPETSAFMREQYKKLNAMSRVPKNSPLLKNSPLSKLPEQESSSVPSIPSELQSKETKEVSSQLPAL